MVFIQAVECMHVLTLVVEIYKDPYSFGGMYQSTHASDETYNGPYSGGCMYKYHYSFSGTDNDPLF